MADVSVHDGEVRIELTVPERVMSLHSGEVRIPIERIVAVRPVGDVMNQLRGPRKPGAGLPGRLAIGTWDGTDQRGRYRDFVVAHGHGPGVVITIAGGPYDRVLLAVDNPQELLATLQG